jgi:hypothetical protein
VDNRVYTFHCALIIQIKHSFSPSFHCFGHLLTEVVMWLTSVPFVIICLMFCQPFENSHLNISQPCPLREYLFYFIHRLGVPHEVPGLCEPRSVIQLVCGCFISRSPLFWVGSCAVQG